MWFLTHLYYYIYNRKSSTKMKVIIISHILGIIKKKKSSFSRLSLLPTQALFDGGSARRKKKSMCFLCKQTEWDESITIRVTYWMFIAHNHSRQSSPHLQMFFPILHGPPTKQIDFNPCFSFEGRNRQCHHFQVSRSFENLIRLIDSFLQVIKKKNQMY